MSYEIVIALMCLLGSTYLAWCVTTRKPEQTLYAFVLLWAFFPKSSRIIYLAPDAEDWPDGITVFTVLVVIALVGIVLALLKNRLSRSSSATRVLKRYAWLLAATGTLSLVIPLILQQFPEEVGATNIWGAISETVEPQWRFIQVLSLVGGAIFAFGCMAFLRTRKQINAIFVILLISGFELAAETLFLYLLHVAPGLDKWVSPNTHRFNSLTYGSYDMVGLVSVLTVGALLYFAGTRDSRRILLLLPILILPVLFTFERAPVVGIGSELCFAAWWAGGRRGYYVLAASALTVLAVVLANVPVLETVAGALGQDVRPDYFSAETAHGRLALYLRGLDSIVYMFPFGAGPGMLRSAMGVGVPETFASLNTPESMSTYVNVASGVYATASHNGFIEFIGDHGLMGLITLGGFVALVVRNFVRWRRLERERLQEDRFATTLQVCTYGMLLGVAVFNQFEATVLPYAISMMLLYFTFLPFSHDAELRVETHGPGAQAHA